MPGCYDEDEDLVHRFLGGDETAFEELFQRHSPWVFRRCLAMVGCWEDAEDLTQEVFLTVYQKLGSFRGEASFRLWLGRICNHRCVDFLRRRERERQGRRRYEQSLTLPRAEDSNPEVSSSEEGKVQRALASLPEGDRLVLTLHYLEERSYTEIAQELGWSVGRVKVRVHRARERFRQAYERLRGNQEATS